MIDNDQEYAFLRKTLSRLLPEAFFHPLWIQFIRDSALHSRDFLEHLLLDLEREQPGEDLIQACQVKFLCAYLQTRLGQHGAALATIEQVWDLTEEHNLKGIACCAAWGACAICVRQGKGREAAHWLARLLDAVDKKQEWLLANVLEIFKQAIENQITRKDSLLEWLLHWGEWEVPEDHEEAAKLPNHRKFAFPAVSMLSQLTHRWSSLWKLARYQNLGAPEGASHGAKPTLALPSPALSSGLKLNQASSTSSSEEITSLTSDSQSPAGGSKLARDFRPEPPADPDDPHSLAVYCLGAFQVYQGERLVENWLSRKALSIFKYLILEHPAPVAKEVLMDTFWPDSDAESARRNLHQAIYALRQILREGQQGFHHILFRNDCYSVNPGVEIWIDYREYEKLVEAGRRLDKAGRLQEAMEQYGSAEGLYQGDFLAEDLYEDWPNLQREQLQNSYFSLVDRLAELYSQAGQYTWAIHLCHKVLAKDRCNEAMHYMLMQCYMAQGQRHLAVRQYQACLRALKEDLGIQPARETMDLYHRIAPRNRG